VQDLFGPVRAALDRTYGVSGIVVKELDGATLFSQRTDEPFPSASVIKVPLVMALYADAADGRLSLDERVAVGSKLVGDVAVLGTGILRDLVDVSDLSLRDLAMLTIALSDNVGTNLLMDRLGFERVAARLAEWGCSRSVLRRRMFDEEGKRKGLENVMTPAETASLLERLLHGECVDRATSDAVLALMKRCQDDGMVRRYLPRSIEVGNKTGTLDASRNDAALIFGPSKTVVVAAFMREVRDTLAAVHILGLVGRAAARAAGCDVPPLPFDAGPGA
jgi:beta-lactamase class A